MFKAPGAAIHGRFLQKLLVVFGIVSFIVFFVIFPSTDNRDQQNLPWVSSLNSELNRNPRAISEQPVKKKILAWTKIFSRDFLIYYKSRVITSDHAFSQCPVHKNCEWTIDRSEVNTADAVVFHFFPKDFKLDDLPAYRSPTQQWVHMNLEPPIRFQDGMMENVDGLFNMTATYEDDSDIHLPYGFYWKREKQLKNYIPSNTNRTKAIVWMVSRCHTLSRREVYAKDLQAHIKVDIFGACGKPAPKKGSPPINLDFRTELAKEYYFYLAFENSDCQDYITEKFWSALLAGLVPIVRGQLPRYEKHAPPGSYINADAFFSYKDLADYLQYLMSHPAEYNKYFEWRRDYAATTIGTFGNLDIHCRLCAFLHEHPHHQKVYKMSERYSKRNRCFDYHHNLNIIKHEPQLAYDDEFKGFLPTKK